MTPTVNYERFQMKKLVLREIKHSVVHGAGKKRYHYLIYFWFKVTASTRHLWPPSYNDAPPMITKHMLIYCCEPVCRHPDFREWVGCLTALSSWRCRSETFYSWHTNRYPCNCICKFWHTALHVPPRGKRKEMQTHVLLKLTSISRYIYGAWCALCPIFY